MTQRLDIRSLIEFGLFSFILVASFIAAAYTDSYLFLLVPVGILGFFISLTNIRLLYYCLLFFLPLSTEMELSFGSGIDFPDEIFMVGLMFLTWAYLVIYPKEFNKALIYSPIILILALHFLWIMVAAMNSSKFIVSLKYTLSKTWYLTTFVILTSLVIRNVESFKKAFWLVTIPLFGTIIYTLIRHGAHGFSFLSVNTMMAPFFRNHVNYAAMISEWIPFIGLAITWYKFGTKTRIFLYLLIITFIVALFLSYTRSSWLALVVSVGIAIVIRLRLIRPALIAVAIGVAVSVVYITSNNKFLDYAPNYERTIYHEGLREHLSSTYKMQDISSAERVYRWVAALRMWKVHPIAGFGPGNFNNFYKGYTVSSFRTYVSRNNERSTVHNYFILMLVEQGLVGFIIFCLLTVVIFVYAEKIYHAAEDKETRRWIMAITMSLAAIYVNNSLSDMIETDKVGSIFFINIAMLSVAGYNVYKKKKEKELAASL